MKLPKVVDQVKCNIWKGESFTSTSLGWVIKTATSRLFPWIVLLRLCVYPEADSGAEKRIDHSAICQFNQSRGDEEHQLQARSLLEQMPVKNYLLHL